MTTASQGAYAIYVPKPRWGHQSLRCFNRGHRRDGKFNCICNAVSRPAYEIERFFFFFSGFDVDVFLLSSPSISRFRRYYRACFENAFLYGQATRSKDQVKADSLYSSGPRRQVITSDKDTNEGQFQREENVGNKFWAGIKFVYKSEENKQHSLPK